MKRLFTLLAALLLLPGLTVPARADLIPLSDTFYEAHRKECETVNFQYEAIRDTCLYAHPDAAPGHPIPAGTTVEVDYIWETSWGGNASSKHWINLEDFRRLYGLSDFEADHQDAFIQEEGAVPVTEETRIQLWSFPGSGISNSSAGGPDGRIPEDGCFFYHLVYTDEDGLKWVETEFLDQRYWICISDPSSSTLPSTAPKYAEEAPTAAVETPTQSPSERPTEAPAAAAAPAGAPTERPTEAPVISKTASVPVLPVVLVIATVVITVLLILLLRKKTAPRRDGT